MRVGTHLEKQSSAHVPRKATPPAAGQALGGPPRGVPAEPHEAMPIDLGIPIVNRTEAEES